MACRLRSRQHHTTTTTCVVDCKKKKVIDGLDNSKDKYRHEHDGTSVNCEMTDKERRRKDKLYDYRKRSGAVSCGAILRSFMRRVIQLRE